MIVFKTFLKVLNQCKIPILLYTSFLIVFGVFNMQTSDQSTSFVANSPNVLIINRDVDSEITKNLIDYIDQNCMIVNIDDDEAIDDALFYRDVNYIIDIPENYGKLFLQGENPTIEVKSTGDYQASYAEMLLSRYLKIAKIYQQNITNEEVLISKINETLNQQTKVNITSKLDTDALANATFYYNFASYSILAGCVYVICLILSSFKEEKIRKRTMISSMNYKKHNQYLLLSNGLFALILWIFYVGFSFVLLKDIMFTKQGIIYMINSLVFTLCAVTIAFFIGNLSYNKNAINGIINVVALGSSFLCGAFVPVEWLPDFVLKIAHILPTYWYIQTNELLKTIEVYNFESLRTVIFNIGIILLFSLFFVMITNRISKKKMKIG